MDLSNKSLAMLLLAAIVISLGGTLISLNKIEQFQGLTGPSITGRQTGTGITNLTVQDLAQCNVDTNVDLGTGQAGNIFVTSDQVNTNSFRDCSNTGSALCRGMEINNTGNVDLNVSFNSSESGSTFLGGPSVQDSDFAYELRNGTFDGSNAGCVNNSGLPFQTGWQTVPTTQTFICNNLTPTDGSDMFTIEYNITLRDSTPSGAKTTNINVVCNQI